MDKYNEFDEFLSESNTNKKIKDYFSNTRLDAVYLILYFGVILYILDLIFHIILFQDYERLIFTGILLSPCFINKIFELYLKIIVILVLIFLAIFPFSFVNTETSRILFNFIQSCTLIFLIFIGKIFYPNYKKSIQIRQEKFDEELRKEFDKWLTDQYHLEETLIINRIKELQFQNKMWKDFIKRINYEDRKNTILKLYTSNIYVLRSYEKQCIFYIGQTIQPHRRLQEHRRNKNFSEYGKITMEIIESNISLNIVDEREKYWIAYFEKEILLKNKTKGGSYLFEKLMRKYRIKL